MVAVQPYAHTLQHIQALPVSAADRAWLTRGTLQVPPGKLIRGMTLDTAIHNTRDAVPATQWTPVANALQHLPPITPFGWVSLPDALLIMSHLALARLGYGQPLESLIAQLTLEEARISNEHPLVKINKMAVQDDFVEFVRIQKKSLSNWQNYGEVDVETPRPGRLLLHYHDCYSTLEVALTRAMHQGLLELFNHRHDGTVEVEIHDAHTYTLEITWPTPSHA